MKRFKKVLALVLAGVLALAMLTACGETDSDKLIPADGSYEIVKAINDEAVKNGKAEVTYSVKYSEVTKNLLKNWLEYRSTVTNSEAYKAGYKAAVKDLGNTKIVIGLVDENTVVEPTSSTAYLTTANSAFKASTIVADDNYNAANRVGVAYYTSGATTYRLVCLFCE